MKEKKGFTLIELIVVIAIIGILLAVLVPTWSYFLMRAQVRSQNNYSKVIFNAAQTQATREKFFERSDYTDLVNMVGDSTTSSDDMAKKRNSVLVGADYKITNQITKEGHSELLILWNGKEAVKLDPSTNAEITNKSTYNDAELQRFISSVNKVFTHSAETVYMIYIKDYKVESVCSARSLSSNNIGSYPVTQDGRSDDSLEEFNMKHINLDKTDDN